MGQDDPSGEVRAEATDRSTGPGLLAEADGTPVNTRAQAGDKPGAVGTSTPSATGEADPDPDGDAVPAAPDETSEVDDATVGAVPDVSAHVDGSQDGSSADPAGPAVVIEDEAAAAQPDSELTVTIKGGQDADPVAAEGEQPAVPSEDVTVLIRGGQDADLTGPDQTVMIRGGQYSLGKDGGQAEPEDPDAPVEVEPVAPVAQADLEQLADPAVEEPAEQAVDLRPEPAPIPAGPYQGDLQPVELTTYAHELRSAVADTPVEASSPAVSTSPIETSPIETGPIEATPVEAAAPAGPPADSPDPGYSPDATQPPADGPDPVEYPADLGQYPPDQPDQPEPEDLGEHPLGFSTHEALEQRRKAIRRQRRQTWTFLAMFGTVLIVGVTGYTYWAGLWSVGDGSVKGAVACPVPTPTAAPIRGVAVSVLNNSQKRGLAQTVARQMQARRFTIKVIGNETGLKPGKDAAVVRHGPSGLLKARTVAAQVAGKVTLLNDKRGDESVDLVLQPGFKALNDTKTASRLTAPPPVKSPDGCVQVG